VKTHIAPRAAASETRRAQILQAALECFTSQGVDSTTIEDIRTRSGASIGSIYHHFGSKEDLAIALYIEGLRSYQDGFVRKLTRHRDAAAGIRAVVEYHLDWVSTSPDWARYLLYLREAEVITSAESALEAINRPFVTAMMDWLEPHIEAGTIVSLPQDLYQPIIVGPLHQFSRQWLAGRGASNIAEAQKVLAEAVWQALRAAEDRN
jgi:AcrR family transcriptional regulator